MFKERDGRVIPATTERADGEKVNALKERALVIKVSPLSMAG